MKPMETTKKGSMSRGLLQIFFPSHRHTVTPSHSSRFVPMQSLRALDGVILAACEWRCKPHVRSRSSATHLSHMRVGTKGTS